jgi:hypothetical protein
MKWGVSSLNPPPPSYMNISKKTKKNKQTNKDLLVEVMVFRFSNDKIIHVAITHLSSSTAISEAHAIPQASQDLTSFFVFFCLFAFFV